MFSDETNAKIGDELSMLQSTIVLTTPLITFLEDGGDIDTDLNLGTAITTPEFLTSLLDVTHGYNGDSEYSSTTDYFTVVFMVAKSEDDTTVAYLTISRDITTESVTATEAALHVVLNKLTDDIYRLEPEA